MNTPSRFQASASAKDAKLLSSQQINQTIEELVALRNDEKTPLDSDSIDNAVALCEKIDICFSSLSVEEKVLIIENYEFFSSQKQFTDLLKVMFQGDLSHKEMIFRSLIHKLRASEAVVKCVLKTQSMFEDEKELEMVRYNLVAFLESLIHAFAKLIPTEHYPDDNNGALSLKWLEHVTKAHNPVLSEDDKSYTELTQHFTDLLYSIFSHQHLPFYLNWRDRYLRYWLLHILREEDRFENQASPELSKLKADVYVEYMNWTKISRRLNANLRQREAYSSPKTIEAEAALLERCPSNVLGEFVQKIRSQMVTGSATDVALGFKDEYAQESNVYGAVLEDVLKNNQGLGKFTELLGGLIQKLKDVASKPASMLSKVINRGGQLERKHPQELVPNETTSRMSFGDKFPDDYGTDNLKYFRLFFSSHQDSQLTDFEESVGRILKYYHSQQRPVVASPQMLEVTGGNKKVPFDEQHLVFYIDDAFLLTLGESHFQVSMEEYLKHPKPHAYFQWFVQLSPEEVDEQELITSSDRERIFRKTPLEELGEYKSNILNALHQVLDSLPDEERSAESCQRLLQFIQKSL